METCIIVTGNPVDGSEYVGPFPNATEATQYAEQFVAGGYWVANIDPPAMETRASIERKTASGEWDAGGVREAFMGMAAAILDDNDGIGEVAYRALLDFARRLHPEFANDLAARVDAADGRFYLPSTRS
jgi:hypothetical protein